MITKTQPNYPASYYDDLYIEVSDKSILQEWKHIKKEDRGYSALYNTNKIVNKYQSKEMFKHEIDMWNKNENYHGMPLRDWLYQNRKQYINKGFGELTKGEVIQGFRKAGIYRGKSYHSPFYIKQFIKDFNVKSIYDPCGGWGHRCLGAISIPDITYIYNDINTATYNNVKEMYKDMKTLDNNISDNVFFNNNDAEDFIPDQDYEAVFTCPPYFNQEIYSDKGAEHLSKKDFLIWWSNVVKTATSKDSCKIFAFIISNKFKEKMMSVVDDTVFDFIKEQEIGSNTNNNHFQRKGNVSRNGEVLLIWKKK